MTPPFAAQYSVHRIMITLNPTTVTHAMIPAKYRRKIIHATDSTNPPTMPHRTMTPAALIKSSM